MEELMIQLEQVVKQKDEAFQLAQKEAEVKIDEARKATQSAEEEMGLLEQRVQELEKSSAPAAGGGNAAEVEKVREMYESDLKAAEQKINELMAEKDQMQAQMREKNEALDQLSQDQIVLEGELDRFKSELAALKG
jgi:chromosome segregation ATPase